MFTTLQELLALLNHLDKDKKGFVSVEVFVQGLQTIKMSATAASVSPPGVKPHRYATNLV